MSKVDILEKISYGLLWGYALVSCWGMDRLPAGFVSVSGLIYLARFAIAPYRIVGVPVLQRAFFLFIGAVVLSTVAAWPGVQWENAWAFVDRILTLPLAVLLCKTRRHVLGLVLAVAASAVITDVYALHQGWQNLSLRINGFFGHPVHLGEHLLLVVCFLLPLSFANAFSGRLRAVFFAALHLSLLTLLFNETRAAWIAFTIVWLLYFFTPLTPWKYAKNRWWGISVSLVILCCIGLGALSPSIQQRIASVTDLQYQSNSERIIIWHSSLAMIADHPVFGVGPDNFGPEYQSVYMRPEAKERHQRDAHNTYLSIAAELGMVGLAAFLFLLFRLLQYYYRQIRRTDEPEWPLGAFFCLVAFFIYGFMNSMINTFWAVRLLSLFLGISLAYANLSRRA